MEREGTHDNGGSPVAIGGGGSHGGDGEVEGEIESSDGGLGPREARRHDSEESIGWLPREGWHMVEGRALRWLSDNAREFWVAGVNHEARWRLLQPWTKAAERGGEKKGLIVIRKWR